MIVFYTTQVKLEFKEVPLPPDEGWNDVCCGHNDFAKALECHASYVSLYNDLRECEGLPEGFIDHMKQFYKDGGKGSVRMVKRTEEPIDV